jgi:hypothetical protein
VASGRLRGYSSGDGQSLTQVAKSGFQPDSEACPLNEFRWPVASAGRAQRRLLGPVPRRSCPGLARRPSNIGGNEAGPGRPEADGRDQETSGPALRLGLGHAACSARNPSGEPLWLFITLSGWHRPCRQTDTERRRTHRRPQPRLRHTRLVRLPRCTGRAKRASAKRRRSRV